MFSGQSFIQGVRPGYENSHFNMYYPMHPPMYNTGYNVNVPQNFAYPPPPIYDNINNEAVPLIKNEKRQSDEQYINNFVLESITQDDANNHKNTNRKSKIALTKTTLISVHKLNEKLESLCSELADNKDLPEAEWQKKMDICITAKAEIIKLLEPLKDKNFLNQLKRDLNKRKKKRLREKSKRQQWKNEKLLREERRARLHVEIDSWIRKEQAVIEKEKQDENLRKDADLILSDVRGKRGDARKYLALLQELQSLRNIKANIARARGEHLSSAADEAFNNIIVNLVEQWSVLDREYCIEEQGLKLMLKSDNERRIEKQKKGLFDEWENVLFGRKMVVSDQFQMNFNNFLTTRAAWDKYISLENDASAIPIGWVVPDKPSSSAWKKCLKKGVS